MKDVTGNHGVSARRLRTIFAAVVLFVASVSVAEESSSADASGADIAALEQQLREAETAFAASFADGDMDAFASFLDEHAIFMGRSNPLRGRKAIVERWTRMRGTGEAPFSWRPERVAVEADGGLGMSTGPVMSPDGTWLSSFVSTWKKTAEGWRVVLDVGPKCPPPTPPAED